MSDVVTLADKRKRKPAPRSPVDDPRDGVIRAQSEVIRAMHRQLETMRDHAAALYLAIDEATNALRQGGDRLQLVSTLEQIQASIAPLPEVPDISDVLPD